MRLHLILGLITALLLVVTLRANQKHNFSFAQVQAQAEKRAMSPYVPLPDVLPPQLKNLTPAEEAGIFSKDTKRLWRKKGLPFQVDFYHQLKSNPAPHIAPLINTVDHKGAHPLGYSSTYFNFLNLNFTPPLPPDLGYAGFYVRYPINKPDSLDGFFSVLGSCYFRPIAKDQVYGLSARGLAINTSVDKKSEEFPNFVEWWLHEPSPTDTSLILDALLDSPSVTGAYRFTVTPGASTSINVQATLFFRDKVDRLGIAPFSSMYLYGENAKDHFGDNVHPEIHDSDGLLMNRGNGEWVWRPLAQTKLLQIYPFTDENPKGFGLVQRDRDFQHYQDLGMKYNVRPSAWVTPQGKWGKGVVQLTQLPTNNTNTDNVVLFWIPEQKPKAGDRLDLNYTVDFYMNDANRPPLAYCKSTYINCPAPPPPPPPPVVTPKPDTAKPGAPPPGKAAAPETPKPPATPPAPAPPKDTVPVQFLVDFIGNGIENIPANEPPHLDLTCNPPGTYIRDDIKVEKNDYDHLWRVTFTIIPLKHNVPTEILCRLTRDGKPITETWSYTWHQ